MDTQIQKNVIKVKDIQQKLTQNNATRISITDANGDYYSFFSTKSDGNPTKAYSQFISEGIRLTDSIEIGFKLRPNPKNPNSPFRSILFLKKAV